MISIAFLLSILMCIGVCRRYICPTQNSNVILSLAVSGALSCFALSTICTVLGLLNLLTQTVVFTLFIIVLSCALWIGRRHFQLPNVLDILISFILSVPYFLMAYVPIWYRDSLTYHAAMPKQYALAEGFVHGDQVLFSYFPQSWHSFIAGWMLIFPDSNPRLIAPCISLLCLWFILGASRHLGASKVQSWTVGIIFMMLPTQLEFGSSLYVQSALMLFTGLACFWSIKNTPKFAVLAGVSAGFCASLKLSGLYVLLLVLLWHLVKKKNIWFFLIPAVSIAAPFYTRNLLETGNPFFPMMWEVFGGSGWDEWRSQAYAQTLSNYGAGRTLVDYMLLPFRVFFTRNMTQDFEGSIGPIVLGISLLALYRGKFTTFWWYMIISWGIIWAFNVQQIRFLMPIIPILLIVSSKALPIKKHWLALVVLLNFGWCYKPLSYLWSRQATTQILTGDISASEFLRKKTPENFPVYEWLNTQKHQTVWLVWMRGYHYYLNAPARIDNVFGAWRFEQLLEKHTSPQTLAEEMAAENIDVIVINHRFFLQDNNADIHLGRTDLLKQRFQAAIDHGVFHVIFVHNSIRVYSLSDSESSLLESAN